MTSSPVSTPGEKLRKNRPRWAEFLRGLDIIGDLLEAAGKIDALFLPPSTPPRTRTWPLRKGSGLVDAPRRRW